MLNVFTLASSINESVANSDLMLGEAYEFAGTVNDASYDFAYLAMQEAVDSYHLDSSVNEIMVEAAINNPENMEALTEASIKEIMGKIKQALLKAWEWVKALIAKIVNWVKATIAKTKAYQKSVQKAADKAMKDGAKPVTVNAYEYDVDAVASLEDKIGGIVGPYIDGEFVNKVDSAMQVCGIVETESDKVDDIVDDLNKKTEAFKEATKNSKNDSAIELNKVLGTGLADDSCTVGAVYTTFINKVRGEKKDIIKTAADVSGLLKNFDRYNKILEDGTKNLKNYEKILKDVNTRLSRVKGTGMYNAGVRNTQEQADTKAAGRAKIQAAASAHLNACYTSATSSISQLSSVLSGANSALRTLCNGMIANDMTIINKVLHGKNAKKKEDNAE